MIFQNFLNIVFQTITYSFSEEKSPLETVYKESEIILYGDYAGLYTYSHDTHNMITIFDINITGVGYV